jgi:hypothetical protein
MRAGIWSLYSFSGLRRKSKYLVKCKIFVIKKPGCASGSVLDPDSVKPESGPDPDSAKCQHPDPDK